MFTISELIKATAGVLRVPAGPHTGAIRGISIDSRTIRQGFAFIALPGDTFDGHDFIAQALQKQAACIICERGTPDAGRWPAAVIEVADTVKALGAIARFHRRRFSIPVIAVTGSNGKTTTKDMVAGVLASRYTVLKTEGTKNNHIGLPMTLLGLKPCHDMAVVELGTNHFGEIEYLAGICEPTVAVITNIGPSHLEYFHTLVGVLREKYSLIERSPSIRIAVLNADDRLLKPKLAAKKQKPLTVGFSCLCPSDFSVSDTELADGTIRFVANGRQRIRLQTIGAHNIYNAGAAIACARIFGVGWHDIARSLAAVTFPPGRLTLRTVEGSRFIDDTYNASPASLRQALYALEDCRTRGRKFVVMGDMAELGTLEERFHREAGKHIARVCDTIVAVGSRAKLSARAAERYGFDTSRIFTCTSVEEARELLFAKIGLLPDDVVLVKGSRLMHMEKIFEKK